VALHALVKLQRFVVIVLIGKQLLSPVANFPL
jgi:hypothetical protein